jgi:hypothetical protein
MYNSGNSSKNVTGSAIVDGTVEAADLATAVNSDIADGVAGKATADLALPKAGGALTGAVTTNSTFDGVDIATRDGILTTTTTTADAALPKAELAYDNSAAAWVANTLTSGAVIERGNNGQGEYTMYADGTLICSSVRSMAVGYAGVNWTFPAGFIAVPALAVHAAPVAQANGERAPRIFGTVNVTTTLATLYVYRAAIPNELAAPRVAGNVDILVIGRWK